MTSPPVPNLSGDWCFLSGRRPQVLPFAVLGSLCVVVGGLVAAVTARAPTEPGTWAAAYLVLVCGVAQAGLGFGQALSTSRTPTSIVAVQVIGWNLGNGGVLAGTLTGRTAVVDVGGALLVGALILLGCGLVKDSKGTGVEGTRIRPVSGVRRWFRFGYGLLIVVLVLSIPVGLVLAHRSA